MWGYLVEFYKILFFVCECEPISWAWILVFDTEFDKGLGDRAGDWDFDLEVQSDEHIVFWSGSAEEEELWTGKPIWE